MSKRSITRTKELELMWSLSLAKREKKELRQSRDYKKTRKKREDAGDISTE
jgi:hypothetical protein